MSDLIPYSRELEEAVLGAVLINPELMQSISLEPSDFYVIRHGWVWEACQAVQREHGALDFVLLTEHLHTRKRLEEMGGPAFLLGLINITPFTYQAPEQAAALRALRTRRDLIKAANEIAKLAYDETLPLEEVVMQAGQKLRTTETPGLDFESVGAWAWKAWDLMQARQEQGSVPFFKTRFLDLDARIEGLDPVESTMVLLCGEPGAGKTILWGQVCGKLAEQAPGALLSLEMSGYRMLYRTLSERTGISALKMRKGQVSESEYPLLAHELEALQTLPLYMATKRTDPETLHTALYRLKRDEGVAWYGLDYLTLLAGYDKLEKWARAESLSQALLQINRDLNLCSVVIHTLNKGGQVAGGKGAQYDADVICTLANDPDTFCSPEMESKVLTFQKIRDSETGTGPVKLLKYKDRPKFVNAIMESKPLNGKKAHDDFWYQK